MIKPKYSKYFFIWFILSTIFSTILIFTMSSVTVDPDFQKVLGFDFTLAIRITYYSIWVNVLTALWAGFTLASLIINKKEQFSKQLFTWITTLNFIISIIFWGGFVIHPSIIISFSTWWQIIVAIIEHLITPVLIIVFYFLTKSEQIKTKTYILKNSWWNLVLPITYIIFITSRTILIHNQGYENPIPAFPYEQLDPYVSPWYITVLLYVAATFASWLFPIFFNYLSNITIDKFNLMAREKQEKTTSHGFIWKRSSTTKEKNND